MGWGTPVGIAIGVVVGTGVGTWAPLVGRGVGVAPGRSGAGLSGEVPRDGDVAVTTPADGVAPGSGGGVPTRSPALGFAFEGDATGAPAINV